MGTDYPTERQESGVKRKEVSLLVLLSVYSSPHVPGGRRPRPLPQSDVSDVVVGLLSARSAVRPRETLRPPLADRGRPAR